MAGNMRVALTVGLEYDLEPGPFAVERAVRDALEAADWFGSLHLTTVLGEGMALVPSGFLAVQEDGATRWTVRYDPATGVIIRLRNYGQLDKE